MPYAVCYSYNEGPWERYGTSNDGKQAAARLKELQGFNTPAQGYRWKIQKLRDDGLPDDWREREAERFRNGTYEPVPWADADWYQPFALEHFVHLSLKQPGKIAYTETAAKGEQDRQTIIGAGRYLTKFFKDALTPSEIEEWACRVSVDAEACGLKITDDPDEIERVYDGGPNSCMRGESCVRVYAGPDLALAYTGEIDNASGRCVVWPEKKIYSTIYGDCTRLQMLLADRGYTRGSIRGARVRRIESDYGFVMPYVDDVSGASDTGEFLVLDDEGRLDTKSTDGHTGLRGTPCDRCGGHVDEEDLIYVDEIEEYWCDGCASDTTYCELHAQRLLDDNHIFAEVHVLSSGGSYARANDGIGRYVRTYGLHLAWAATDHEDVIEVSAGDGAYATREAVEFAQMIENIARSSYALVHAPELPLAA
jgi:hypothetical protein